MKIAYFCFFLAKFKLVIVAEQLQNDCKTEFLMVCLKVLHIKGQAITLLPSVEVPEVVFHSSEKRNKYTDKLKISMGISSIFGIEIAVK